MSLAEVPQDVLLELAKELNVGDLFSFLSICRTTRELRFQRSLWLDALIRLRELEKQPLPFQNGEALNTLSLPELQNIVHQIQRLMNNLSSAEPRPARIRTLSLPASSRIFCIPGANLAVSHTRGHLSCWDVLTGHRVAHLGIPELRVGTEAPYIDTRGRALIGAYLGLPGRRPNVTNLMAIWIDFRDRAHVYISHTISPPLNDTDQLRSGFFINSEVMGFCTTSHILSWPMTADRVVRTRLKPPPLDVRGMRVVSCLPFGQSLYILARTFAVTETAIHTLPLLPAPGCLPIGDAHPADNMTTLTIPYPIGSSPEDLPMRGRGLSVHSKLPHVVAPDYGIFAVTCRTLVPRARGDQVPLIHFWPGRVTHGNLEFGQVHLYEHFHPIREIAVGVSGTYVLLLVVEEEDGYLGLLHFSATPAPNTTFRKLDVQDVSPSFCSQIALDESLGLVCVVDTTGVVEIISYV
ncbi:hypothetical protein B0H19DRAFT_1275522 [Mycena capillaripes]|nr:hypothetical protein B0H19DRAFT_1275522 [Mycena capillaripes]